jgi:inner membrane protein
VDPLTHTLVGATLGETRLKRLTPLATPTLIIAANLPDVDVVSYAWGEHTALAFRRGWTHGAVALVVLPLILTAVMVAWGRWRRSARDRGGGRRRSETVEDGGGRSRTVEGNHGQARAVADRDAVRPLAILSLATLGVATHPALDWLNTYGMRWLMPFDGRWFYGDTLFIVDPWLWLLLGGAVFLARSRSRWAVGGWALLATFATMVLFSWAFIPPLAKVGWAIGIVSTGFFRVVRGPHARADVTRRLATAALVLSLTYIGAMSISGRLAAREASRRLTLGGAGPIARLMAGPLPADPLGRDVVAETPGGYWTGSLRWRRTPPLIAGRPPIQLAPDDSAVRAAAGTPQVRAFLGWARFPFVEIDTTLHGFTVYFLDARYTRTRTRGFGSAVVDLDGTLSPVAASLPGEALPAAR